MPATEVVLPPDVPGVGDLSSTPQMEFVFRTLVALKVDVEDLKRDFELYKTRAPQLPSAQVPEWPEAFEVEEADATVIEPGWPEPSARADGMQGLDPAPADFDDTPSAGPDGSSIAFRPGMTMAELEREAIVATLQSVGGNRRRAAEQLQIGERTLYRKIKQYEIEL